MINSITDILLNFLNNIIIPCDCELLCLTLKVLTNIQRHFILNVANMRPLCYVFIKRYITIIFISIPYIFLFYILHTQSFACDNGANQPSNQPTVSRESMR